MSDPLETILFSLIETLLKKGHTIHLETVASTGRVVRLVLTEDKMAGRLIVEKAREATATPYQVFVARPAEWRLTRAGEMEWNLKPPAINIQRGEKDAAQ